MKLEPECVRFIDPRLLKDGFHGRARRQQCFRHRTLSSTFARNEAAISILNDGSATVLISPAPRIISNGDSLSKTTRSQVAGSEQTIRILIYHCNGEMLLRVQH